jgi:hypothetical protein
MHDDLQLDVTSVGANPSIVVNGAMEHLSSHQLVELIRRCHGEESKKPTVVSRVGPSDWISEWMEGIFSRSPAINKIISQRCLACLKDARHAAGFGTMEDACRAFAEARILSGSDKLKPEIRIMLQAQLAASEAYLSYSCGDYEEATQFLREALACDAVLEKDFGYHLIFANQLHLVNNVIRVKGLSGDIRGALELARDVVLYTGRITDAVPGFWSGNHLDGLKPDMITYNTGMLLAEVALLMVCTDYDAACAASEVFFDDPAVQAVSQNWLPQFREWLEVKHAFLSDSPRRYLQDCYRFLSNGQGYWPLLWIITLVDAVAIAMSEAPEPGTFLRREVLISVRGSKYMPGTFKGARLRIRHGDAWKSRNGRQQEGPLNVVPGEFGI